MLRGFLATVLIASAAILAAPEAQASRWGKSYFPDVRVVTHDGKTVRFYDDLIKDRIFVISFLFTTCRDICPLTTSRLAELQAQLGDAMGRDIFFYSITIDPENDTPEKMKQYADTFGAGPGWLFLTGAPADIHTIRHKLGERSKVLSDHRNEILLGNGRTGEWARNNVMGDLTSLALTVRSMDPAWRPGPGLSRTPPKVLELGARPGQALFKRLCAGCHTVGKGDRVGPDLEGVTLRRDPDWLVKFIANPEKLRRQRDPTALALVRRYPTVRMPAFGISENDAQDLIAFLDPRPAVQSQADLLTPLSALTDQYGAKFSLERLKGHPVAVFFGFTHCPDVCPTTLLDWSNVLGSLGPDGDNLKVIFVSVDGDRDTPEALKSYMGSFDPRIMALTGAGAEIAAAARPFEAFYEKVTDAAGGGFTYDHTVKTYLIDRNGRLAGTVDLRTNEAERRKTLARILAPK
jgi:cytochrome oxidase Cu insertion factor (SCO1/SenC/PrrC family)